MDFSAGVCYNRGKTSPAQDAVTGQPQNCPEKEQVNRMKKPILVVMAAGMGSRYGGLKQMDPVGPNGEFIIDYSLYDARRAGFETVVFIIKHEIEDAFRETVGQRVADYMEVRYAFQQVENLPAGYAVPQGRVKPWGTGHAILSAKEVIDAPFAVINADDYYGVSAFQTIYQHLAQQETCNYYMVGYQLKNTVTENGSVARGVCQRDQKGYLVDITEHTQIETTPDGIRSTLPDGTVVPLADDTVVSMNLWGFPAEFMNEVEAQFPAFLDDALQNNPLKGEYFLPGIVSQALEEGKAKVTVLTSDDQWYGVTYQEDRPVVVAALKQMTDSGLYPAPLWG